LLQRIEQGIARRLAEPAMAGGMQQAMDLEDLVDVVLRAVAVGDLVHAVGDQRGADPAGRAEAAALVREEVGEIARHLEHVAMRAENHESAGRRHVLESNVARELVHRQTASRRAADLHRLRVAGAAVVEHLRHRNAEGVLVDSRLSTSPEIDSSLVPVDCLVPRPANQAPPWTAISAALHSVSTLFTTVGWPR
jgi:hypothetical protein